MPFGRVVHALLTRPVPSEVLHRERGTPRAPDPAAVDITWLGTAGLVVEHAGAVLVVDPFVTRPGIRETLLRPLGPDPVKVRRYVPRADVVLCTHSHHDHLLDVPEVALQTGALVFGSPSTANLCRASGVGPSRIREVDPPVTVEAGPFRIGLRPSVHGRAVLGRVPSPGAIPPGVTPPLRLRQFGSSGRALRIFHLGSADFLPGTIAGLRCDVLATCLAGRHRRPGYLRELVGELRPMIVIPLHFDDFFTPMESVTRQLPKADVEGFSAEVRRLGDGCRPVVLDRQQTLRIPLGSALSH
jgi:L-ascorbate metabolism protein UlaG (beta-lactamase superfamily)